MARILVVDDDAMVRETMLAALRAAGHEVAEAQHGLEALEVLPRQPVDLVILDIVMPEMDGIGLIREIRKRHATLPLLAVSGGGRKINLEFLPVAKKLGANTVLAKPFTPKQLLAAVNVALAIQIQPVA